MTTTPPADEAVPAAGPVTPSGRYSTKAVIGLILAIVSVLCLLVPVLNWALAIPGVILAHLAISEIKTTHDRGHEIAVAALVIGYAGIALTLVLLIASAGLANANTPPGQNHDACVTQSEPSDAQMQKCIDSYNQ